MKKRSKILIHVLFWFYILNQNLFPLYINKTSENYHLDVLISMFLNILCFYLFYFCLTCIFRLRSKWIGILLGVAAILLIVPLRTGIDYLFWDTFGNLPKEEMKFSAVWVWNELRMVIIISTYALLIRFTIDWFDAQKLKNELLSQQQASELALLRSQINPHFLFNTLNNIYALVYSKSDQAPAAVMKLSSIMRYMLYDSNTEKVPLEKEIEYLKSFIELQKLRLRKENFVKFDIFGEIEGRYIVPMLLIPFVENAFKHSNKDHEPAITISLTAEPARLVFIVENYVKSFSATHKDTASGIGLQNTRRRLDLLYPGKHRLEIADRDKLFSVHLVIEN